MGDDVDALHILGEDARLLISTIDRNLTFRDGELHFQRKVAYDNLPTEALPALRTLTHQEGQHLLETADRYLAQQDRDTNPNSTGTGRKHAGIGIYYFEEDVPPRPEVGTTP